MIRELICEMHTSTISAMNYDQAKETALKAHREKGYIGDPHKVKIDRMKNGKYFCSIREYFVKYGSTTPVNISGADINIFR